MVHDSRNIPSTLKTCKMYTKRLNCMDYQIYVLLLLSILYITSVFALECTDWQGKTVSNGDEYYADGNEPCTLCRCENGFAVMCRTESCNAQECPNGRAITGECLGPLDEINFQLENGSLIQDDRVNVLEGTALWLRCITNLNLSTTSTWLRDGEKTILVTSEILRIDSFQLVHQGKYTCFIRASNGMVLGRSVQIHCLYPPKLPTLSGPGEVVLGQNFSVLCNTSSFPLATFWWTLEPKELATVVAQGSSLVMAVQESKLVQYVYCWAENTMVPTSGEPVSARIWEKKRIVVHKPVYIWGLYEKYTFYVGNTVDITCNVAGLPEPEVYWTKNGDPSFSYRGPRLFQQNIQKSFSGYYACHANNMITNGVRTSDTRNTLIEMEDSSIPAECLSYCTTDTSCDFSSTNASNNSSESNNLPPGGTDKSCDSSCSRVIIAVTVIGWIVAVTLIVAGIFCWIKYREKTNSSDKMVAREVHTLTTESGPTTLTYRRDLPSLPYNVLDIDHTTLEHNYNQLPVNTNRKPERIRSNNTVKGKDDGYLTPVVSVHNNTDTKPGIIVTEDTADVDSRYLSHNAGSISESAGQIKIGSHDYIIPIAEEEKSCQ